MLGDVAADPGGRGLRGRDVRAYSGRCGREPGRRLRLEPVDADGPAGDAPQWRPGAGAQGAGAGGALGADASTAGRQPLPRHAGDQMGCEAGQLYPHDGVLRPGSRRHARSRSHRSDRPREPDRVRADVGARKSRRARAGSVARLDPGRKPVCESGDDRRDRAPSAVRGDGKVGVRARHQGWRTQLRRPAFAFRRCRKSPACKKYSTFFGASGRATALPFEASRGEEPPGRACQAPARPLQLRARLDRRVRKGGGSLRVGGSGQYEAVSSRGVAAGACASGRRRVRDFRAGLRGAHRRLPDDGECAGGPLATHGRAVGSADRGVGRVGRVRGGVGCGVGRADRGRGDRAGAVCG